MNWKYIRFTTLISLILFSLFLTWRMWTAGSSYEESQPVVQSPTPSLSFERPKGHVFGPTQLIVHETTEKKASLNQAVLSDVEQITSEWEITSIADATQVSKEAFQEMMGENLGIELVYEGQTPFGLIKKYFDRLPGEYENKTFNRAFYPVANFREIYFYDSVMQVLYTAEVENKTQADMESLMSYPQADSVAVNSVKLKNQYIYLPVEKTKVAYRDYMVERLPNSLFVNFFFTDTSNVNVRRTENVTRYVDYVSELRINERNNLLTYRKQQPINKSIGLGDRLDMAFSELVRIEKWTEDIHYHNYNPETRTVTFRRYLEGLPVFGELDYGVVQIRSDKENLTYVKLPLEVIKTPIARVEEDPTVEVASGNEVLAQIESAGLSLDEVENIQLGLSWEKSEESTQVVRFSPRWHILEKGSWYEIEKYLAFQGGELPDEF